MATTPVPQPPRSELSLRQEAVKELRARYREELGSSTPEQLELSTALLGDYRELMEERGVPIYGEEALAAITLLEAFIDFTEENSVEEIRATAAAILHGLLRELDQRWRQKDRSFFTE